MGEHDDKRGERNSVSTNDVLREVTEDEVTETNNIRQVELRHKHKTKLEPPDHTKTQYPPRYILPLWGKCRLDI